MTQLKKMAKIADANLATAQAETKLTGKMQPRYNHPKNDVQTLLSPTKRHFGKTKE